MFPALLSKLKSELAAIKLTIEFSDSARDYIADRDVRVKKKLAVGIPSNTDWRTYDHCVALIRIYAVYEMFIEELITSSLSLLPNLYSYEDLTTKMRNEHRNGIANLLPKLHYARYSHLTPHQLITDYHKALSGQQPYVIAPESFLRHEQNLNLSTLQELFSKLGIDNNEAWLSNHRLIKEYFIIKGSRSTAKSELNAFLEYRNAAAHKKIENILGKESLLNYSLFIESLCEVMYERVYHWLEEQKIILGNKAYIGEVNKSFRKGRIIIAMIENATVNIGDILVFKGDYYCYEAIISSIQVNSVDVPNIVVTAMQEIGIGTEIPVPLSAKISFQG